MRIEIINCFVNFHHRCSLWLKYGTLANETTVILVNTVGATLYLSYFIIFWMFTINTRAIYRQFFSAILALGLVLSYTGYYEENRAAAIEVVGEFLNEFFSSFNLLLFLHYQLIFVISSFQKKKNRFCFNF